MDIEKIMDGLSKEILVSLKAMSKTKDLDEKERHSRILKNVSESMGVFFDFAGGMMPYDFEDDPDPDDIPF